MQTNKYIRSLIFLFSLLMTSISSFAGNGGQKPNVMHPRFLAATVGALVAGPMHLVERLRGGWEHAPDQASTTFESGSPQGDSEEKEKEASVSATPDYPISLQEQDSTITSAPLTEEDPAELNQAFFEAVGGNQWDRAQELLSRGDIVNAVNRVGQSALHIAAFLGHVEIIELLLAYDANALAVDRDGRTALDVANIYEQPRVASLLAGLQESVPAFLGRAGSARPRPEDLSGVQETDQERRGQRSRLFLVEDNDSMEDEEESSIFPYAAEEAAFLSNIATGFLEVEEMLPLPRADMEGEIRKQLRVAVKLVVQRAAEEGTIFCVDFNSMSNLELAVRYGILEIVKLLVENNRDRRAYNMEYDHAPFLAAARFGRLKVAQYFLENGANVNFVNGMGQPALLYALEQSRDKMVELLFDYGANIHLVDVDGVGALQFWLDGDVDPDYFWPQDYRMIDILFAAHLETGLIERKMIEKYISLVFKKEQQIQLFSDLLYDPWSQLQIGMGMGLSKMMPKTFAWLRDQRAKVELLEAHSAFNAVSSNSESSNNPNMTDDLDQRDDNSMQDDGEDPEEEEEEG